MPLPLPGRRCCNVCGGTTSNPTSFLLSCISCSSFYHHRCHRPPIPEKVLIDVIREHNDTVNASKRPAPWNWKCAACSLRTLSPDIQLVEPSPEIIDLTVSDSDDKEPVSAPSPNPNTAELERVVAKPAEPQPDRIEEHAQQNDNPMRSEQAKTEEAPVNLPPHKSHGGQVKTEEFLVNPKPSHNLAPAWIHKQHTESSLTDLWDRFAIRTPPRRPRKTPARLTTRHSSEESFAFYLSQWLDSRRQTLPV